MAAAAAGWTLQGKTLKTFGVQLYTLRSIINDKPLEVLQALEGMGYREVEVIRGNIDKVWPALQQTKLKATSLHMDTQLFTKDQAKLGPALEEAAAKGFKYVVCPYVAPADRGGEDVIKKLAETLNRAGAECRKSGVTLCYHNHAFEFAPAGQGTLLDVLMGNTDPKAVQLELDIMWSKVAGVEPVSVLAKYRGRVPLLHLKNLKTVPVAPQYNERVGRDQFEEVGKGVIDVKAVLQASAKAGVKHYFVEQDQTPGNPLESVKGSASYLRSLSF